MRVRVLEHLVQFHHNRIDLGLLLRLGAGEGKVRVRVRHPQSGAGEGKAPTEWFTECGSGCSLACMVFLTAEPLRPPAMTSAASDCLSAASCIFLSQG